MRVVGALPSLRRDDEFVAAVMGRVGMGQSTRRRWLAADAPHGARAAARGRSGPSDARRGAPRQRAANGAVRTVAAAAPTAELIVRRGDALNWPRGAVEGANVVKIERFAALLRGGVVGRNASAISAQ